MLVVDITESTEYWKLWLYCNNIVSLMTVTYVSAIKLANITLWVVMSK